MRTIDQLPVRERVFVRSLQYHGFRLTGRRKNLKRKRGYVIPATRREDSGGIDFWVKMPCDARLLPVQITQRGVRMFRKRQRPSATQLEEFIEKRSRRIALKRRMCRMAGIVFVLVRDYEGVRTNRTIAWGDVKSLRYWVAHANQNPRR